MIQIINKKHRFRPRMHLLRPTQGRAAKLNIARQTQLQHTKNHLTNLLTRDPEDRTPCSVLEVDAKVSRWKLLVGT